MGQDTERLQVAVTRRTDAEAALAAEEKALVVARRAIADRREGLAKLTGQVGALRSRAAAAEAEIGRLSGRARRGARPGRAGRRPTSAALQAEAGGLDEGEVDLDERHEVVAVALAEAQDRLAALQADEREAERDRSTWAARRDALALSLARKDGSGHLLAGDVAGVLGTVASLITVQPGSEAAVAAALGAVADAVAVASPAEAAAALQQLKDEDAGRAGLLVGGLADDRAADQLAGRCRPARAGPIDLSSSPRRRCARRSPARCAGSPSSATLGRRAPAGRDPAGRPRGDGRGRPARRRLGRRRQCQRAVAARGPGRGRRGGGAARRGPGPA